MRARKGDPVHGWVVIDKALGPTSAATVSRVRRLFNARRAGHAGTLDPLATGVLPIALGEATKAVSRLVDSGKSYRFTARFGVGRDTDDAEGRVTSVSDVRPGDRELRAALGEFRGTVVQRPPLYSAVRVGGRRSHARARSGETAPPPPREVRVDAFDLVDRPDRDTAVFEVVCGKGTYVRSLVRDLAARLGSCAHVVALRRTAVGPFGEKDAVGLEKISGTGYNAPGCRHLLPVAAALDDIPALSLTEAEAAGMRNGCAVPAAEGRVRGAGIVVGTERETVLCVGPEETPVALARLVGREIRPFRVFNL